MKKIGLAGIILLVGFSGLWFYFSKDYVLFPQQYHSELLDQRWTDKIPLTRGFGHQKDSLSKVTVSDSSSFVLRDLSNHAWPDKLREIQAQWIASKTGYGPSVYAYDIQKGLILMEYIEQCPQKATYSQKADYLAQVLRKMHEGPKFLPALSLFDRIDAEYASIKKFPKNISLDALKQCIATIKNETMLKGFSTHNDLNLGNVLFDCQEYKLIDFESAGLGDPFYDLATIAALYFESTPYEEVFLSNYFGRALSDEEYKHYVVMKEAFFLVYALGILRSLPESILDEDVDVFSITDLAKAHHAGLFDADTDHKRLILVKSILWSLTSLHKK